MFLADSKPLPIRARTEPTPSQLVSIVMKMHQARPGYPRKLACHFVIGIPLELQSANDVLRLAQLQPTLDVLVEAARVADHVGEQPAHGGMRRRIERKSALLHEPNRGHALNPRFERRFVDTDDSSTERSEHPGPTPRTASEIQTKLAFARHRSRDREQLPQLQIGATGRRVSILDELDCAIGEWTRAPRACEQRMLVEECPAAERFTRRTRTKADGLEAWPR